MSVASDRVNYITKIEVNYTKKVSINALSKATDIPYSTLYYVSKGERELPSKYNDVLKNYYSHEVYYNLRGTGLNSVQSNRFRNSAVEKVSSLTSQIYQSLDYYTSGTVISKASKLDYLPSKKEIEEMYDKALEAIQNGLTKSKQSVEDWIQYGS